MRRGAGGGSGLTPCSRALTECRNTSRLTKSSRPAGERTAHHQAPGTPAVPEHLCHPLPALPPTWHLPTHALNKYLLNTYYIAGSSWEAGDKEEEKKRHKVVETESRRVVAKGRREEEKGELVFNGYRISAGEDENRSEVYGGDGCITM